MLVRTTDGFRFDPLLQILKRKGDAGPTHESSGSDVKRKRAAASSADDDEATPGEDASRGTEHSRTGGDRAENDASEQVRFYS